MGIEKITAIIVDDDPIIRQSMEYYLSQCPQIEILASFADGRLLLKNTSRHMPQAVFMDIEMPGSGGIALAAELRAINPAIALVFVTGHPEYAATAFQLDAVDYLVKPVTGEKIMRSVAKIERSLNTVRNAPAAADSIIVKHKHELYFINQDDIIFVEKELRHTIIHTNDQNYITNESLSSITQRLGPHFFRCHKSFLINIKKIERIFPIADRIYKVVFQKSSKSVSMGRKAFEDLCLLLGRNI